MKLFSREPFFELFPRRRLKFDEHFTFLHVEQDAPRGDLPLLFLCAMEPLGKLFGTLAR
jgi:hypothetical protein